MARMHSRAKGKAGSKKPSKKSNYTWMNYKPKEIEMLIIKLAKEGNSTSKIGLILRDSYGIPDVKAILKKNISDILEKKELLPKVPENLSSLLHRVIALQKHLENNKKDTTAKRGLMLTESKIRRLVKYYKKTGKLPETWNYDPARVKLLIE
ncbi:MAG: 30S ribosomal protein S15 [Candidatus Woesearchaeota archaeon]